LVVVEEHLAAGGLASLLREHLANEPDILSLSPAPTVLNQVGSQEFLRQQAGIDAAAVMATIRRIF
jgi:transketolase C-terminal domain/subunit